MLKWALYPDLPIPSTSFPFILHLLKREDPYSTVHLNSYTFLSPSTIGSYWVFWSGSSIILHLNFPFFLVFLLLLRITLHFLSFFPLLFTRNSSVMFQLPTESLQLNLIGSFADGNGHINAHTFLRLKALLCRLHLLKSWLLENERGDLKANEHHEWMITILILSLQLNSLSLSSLYLTFNFAYTRYWDYHFDFRYACFTYSSILL